MPWPRPAGNGSSLSAPGRCSRWTSPVERQAERIVDEETPTCWPPCSRIRHSSATSQRSPCARRAIFFSVGFWRRLAAGSFRLGLSADYLRLLATVHPAGRTRHFLSEDPHRPHPNPRRGPNRPARPHASGAGTLAGCCRDGPLTMSTRGWRCCASAATCICRWPSASLVPRCHRARTGR